MATIYLSSTYSDLIEHRNLVYRALRRMHHHVIGMEDYVATDQRPLDKCLADVGASDLYIGIFAWRYGFVPEEERMGTAADESRAAPGAGTTTAASVATPLTEQE